MVVQQKNTYTQTDQEATNIPSPSPLLSRQENGFLFLVAWYRWSWFIAPFQGLELTSGADVRMRTLIRAREMGPDGLAICQSCDGCFADTITVNSITVTLCFYPEALRLCWHVFVCPFVCVLVCVCVCLFQLLMMDKLSDGIVLYVMLPQWWWFFKMWRPGFPVAMLNINTSDISLV